MSADTRSTRDSWWRTAPVLVIAILALIISTAGGAYAVGKNSVGSKQLKKNAVSSSKIKNNSIQSSDVRNNTITSSDVKNGSLTAGDFAAGVLPPAAPSRTYFAKVDAAGSLVARSIGIVSSNRESGKMGLYQVKLSFDATRCAVTATSSDSTVSTSASASGTAVSVSTRSLDGGSLANTDLSVTVVC